MVTFFMLIIKHFPFAETLLVQFRFIKNFGRACLKIALIVNMVFALLGINIISIS